MRSVSDMSATLMYTRGTHMPWGNTACHSSSHECFSSLITSAIVMYDFLFLDHHFSVFQLVYCVKMPQIWNDALSHSLQRIRFLSFAAEPYLQLHRQFELIVSFVSEHRTVEIITGSRQKALVTLHAEAVYVLTEDFHSSAVKTVRAESCCWTSPITCMS